MENLFLYNMVLAGVFAVYQYLFEIISIGLSTRHLKQIRVTNLFINLKVWTGVLGKLNFLLQSAIAVRFVHTHSSYGYIIGIFLVICQVVSQLRSLQLALVGLHKNKLLLLPSCEQNHKVSFATGHLGLHAIYEKLTLEPSERSVKQGKQMTEELAMLKQYEQERKYT